MRPHRIACLQTRPMPEMALAVDEAMPLARQAMDEGAEFLFLPEYCGGLKTEGAVLAPPCATENKHDVLLAFREFALQNKVWVMLGSIAVPAPDGKIINRGFVIDATGKIQSRYDKIHMFDIQLSENESYRESARVAPGNQASLVETPIGTIGHTICYDLRFPQLYRDLAQSGAELLCAPAAFVKETGEAHWHVLNRARAIENGSYMISPCAIGSVPGGGASYGHSLIVDPWGAILADGGETPGVICADIDLDQVQSARSRIPSLTHDRRFSITTSEDRSVA